ncbi:MAG: hydroxymethylbilane synthase [Anaerolineae bacterium]|nr:hydroxymethylbilane synthase [Anaerolineae bacterium]MCB0205964.1 hydroxymethylbilane synthase [Anaerolineae bacterium]
MPDPVVRLGTRGSALARWQTDHVASLLRSAWPNLVCHVEIIQTQGDRVLDTPLPLIGGKGVFTAELEAALRSGAIDLAVHSLKDLPTETPAGLALGAVPERAQVADVLVSRAGYTLDVLPDGGTVGTSSRRRAAQLLARRPDLHIVDLRGNVDTRIRKALADDGPYDAIVLAHAGLARLGHSDVISQVLPLDVMLPAPAQGALGIQCRDEAVSLDLLAPLNHAATRQAVEAERAFLVGLGGGCSVPIAAFATLDGDRVFLRGRVSAVDGSRQIDVSGTIGVTDAARLGHDLARQALTEGAGELLAAAEGAVA